MELLGFQFPSVVSAGLRIHPPPPKGEGLDGNALDRQKQELRKRMRDLKDRVGKQEGRQLHEERHNCMDPKVDSRLIKAVQGS